MEDLAVYGWIAPTKLKIVIALALTDAVVKDKEIVTVSIPMPHCVGLTFTSCVDLLDLQGTSPSLPSSPQQSLSPSERAGRSAQRSRCPSYFRECTVEVFDETRRRYRESNKRRLKVEGLIVSSVSPSS